MSNSSSRSAGVMDRSSESTLLRHRFDSKTIKLSHSAKVSLHMGPIHQRYRGAERDGTRKSESRAELQVGATLSCRTSLMSRCRTARRPDGGDAGIRVVESGIVN